MTNGNKKKRERLGMSYGKANNILRKKILFALIKRSKLDICYRCGKKIEKIEELSIEHKLSWLNSDNPKRLFFDLNNIAFSHLICNIDNGRNSIRIVSPAGKYWCNKCKQHKLKTEFRPSRKFRHQCCRACDSKYRHKYLAKKAKFRQI